MLFIDFFFFFFFFRGVLELCIWESGIRERWPLKSCSEVCFYIYILFLFLFIFLLLFLFFLLTFPPYLFQKNKINKIKNKIIINNNNNNR